MIFLLLTETKVLDFEAKNKKDRIVWKGKFFERPVSSNCEFHASRLSHKSVEISKTSVAL